jgi:hypothetical protein
VDQAGSCTSSELLQLGSVSHWPRGPNNRWAKYIKQRQLQEEARVAVKDAVEVGNGTLEMTRQMKNAELQTDRMVEHAIMAARSNEVEILVLVSNINSVTLFRLSSKDTRDYSLLVNVHIWERYSCCL